MALNFPNTSRSYDTTRHAVRFWGYEQAMETSFFVTAGALQQLQPGIRPDEESLLQAFDSHRDVICATANRVYKRGSRGSYDLSPADFS
ncbi:MAG: DUF1488 domain-containing protein [Hyphomicrobiales bacterium]|nr:DUF1488 domain-containing protein [Alphaproteobacteria bacterium]